MIAVGDFFLYFIYSLSFLLGMMIFYGRQNRRPAFFMRFTTVWASLAIICALLAWYRSGEVLSERTIYMLLSLLAWMITIFLFNGKWLLRWYTFCSGLLVETAFSSLSSLVVFLFGLSDQYVLNNILPMVIIRLTVFAAVYGVIWLIVGRKIWNDSEFEISVVPTLLLFILVGSLLAFFNDIGTTLRQQGDSKYITLCLIRTFFSIVMLTFIYYFWDHSKKLALEKAEVEMKKQRIEQLQVMNDVIADLNIKIHDLKHHLVNISDGQLDRVAVQDLNEAIQEYDVHVLTGNDVLDLLLTEKNLRCRIEQIDVVFSVDGSCLTMLTSTEIRALFGNALDNAIQYLSSVEPEHRYLTVICVRESGLVHIMTRNYCTDSIVFDSNGMPQTTKGSEKEHGFGTKSIIRIAEAHHGAASFKIENDAFVMSIILPA